MSLDTAFQGSLFANDFLCDSVAETSDWQALDDAALDTLDEALRAIFDNFPIDGSPNESQTEDDLIWPVLARLGWTATLRRQNLCPSGMTDVPDGLLFADDAVKDRANRFAHEWKRYGFGLALVESKHWLRPLDRRSERAGRGDGAIDPDAALSATRRRSHGRRAPLQSLGTEFLPTSQTRSSKPGSHLTKML